MFDRYLILNRKGFTLIELVSIMIIIGVLATVVATKFDILADTASQKALINGVNELNARESLTWTNIKLSPAGWTNDADVFNGVDTDLGDKYVWTDGPDVFGGTLDFESESSILNRSASTPVSWGKWN